MVLAKKTVKTIKPVKAKEEVKNNAMISVVDITGKMVEEVAIPKHIFEVEVPEELLAQYVRVYLANKRQGTHSTKTRSEVIGTTKKVYRQKGTGRARHGSQKASLFSGGGVTFGPKPRDYGMKLNDGQKRKSLLGALTLRFRANDIVFVQGLLASKKTREVDTALKALELKDTKVLLVIPAEKNAALMTSSRNIKKVTSFISKALNAYEVLNAKKIIFTKEALDEFAEFIK